MCLESCGRSDYSQDTLYLILAKLWKRPMFLFITSRTSACGVRSKLLPFLWNGKCLRGDVESGQVLDVVSGPLLDDACLLFAGCSEILTLYVLPILSLEAI